jgi:hypothetical protein
VFLEHGLRKLVSICVETGFSEFGEINVANRESYMQKVFDFFVDIFGWMNEGRETVKQIERTCENGREI